MEQTKLYEKINFLLKNKQKKIADYEQFNNFFLSNNFKNKKYEYFYKKFYY